MGTIIDYLCWHIWSEIGLECYCHKKYNWIITTRWRWKTCYTDKMSRISSPFHSKSRYNYIICIIMKYAQHHLNLPRNSSYEISPSSLASNSSTNCWKSPLGSICFRISSNSLFDRVPLQLTSASLNAQRNAASLEEMKNDQHKTCIY